MEYRYKELSHIECYETRKLLPSEAPELIKVGERYDDCFVTVEPSVATADKTRRRFFESSLWDYYKATEERWQYAHNIGGSCHIMELFPKIFRLDNEWYERPKIVAHFLDGTTTTKYFNSDSEMETYANINFSGLNKRMRS